MKEKIERALQAIRQPIPLTENNIKKLEVIERFYAPIGGIEGYHRKVCALLKGEERGLPIFSKAPVSPLTPEATVSALRALSDFGELYPLGGLGSRLDLRGERGEMLPAAALPFLGKSLLEGLVRDVEAREYLHFKLFGKWVITPIAMMASEEAHNFPYILDLCEKADWFGRGKENFRLFTQPSVPLFNRRGEWVVEGEELLCQPNGHGALWKAALESGVFDWFHERGRRRLLIRQINNPIGGIDDGLLAFMGTGILENKAFGFAACERARGVQEGMLVHVEEGGKRRITNIEYTDLEKSGIEERDFPANTNILYADLEKLLPAIRANPLPGLMINLKGGEAGRLESMMQSIADALGTKEGEPLSTFLTFNSRRRTISSAKKAYKEGGSLASTPVGAYYDWLANAHTLLTRCGFALPPFPSESAFVKHGTPFAFLYTPKLGPLYAVIEQKLRGGTLAEGSALILSHPDIYIENLDLDGSLAIEGKCILRNVRVRGEKMPPHLYWEKEIANTITLCGSLIAEDVELTQSVAVPPGEVWHLTPSGLTKGSDWEFSYSLQGDQIDLSM